LQRCVAVLHLHCLSTRARQAAGASLGAQPDEAQYQPQLQQQQYVTLIPVEHDPRAQVDLIPVAHDPFAQTPRTTSYGVRLQRFFAQSLRSRRSLQETA
jgi:hypothetical protein